MKKHVYPFGNMLTQLRWCHETAVTRKTVQTFGFIMDGGVCCLLIPCQKNE